LKKQYGQNRSKRIIKKMLISMIGSISKLKNGRLKYHKKNDLNYFNIKSVTIIHILIFYLAMIEPKLYLAEE
jgi:hypothetical protein